jgi:hypothetical protein
LGLHASTKPKVLALSHSYAFPNSHVPGYGSFRATFLLQKGNFRSTFFHFSIVTVFKISQTERQEREFQQKVKSRGDETETKARESN